MSFLVEYLRGPGSRYAAELTPRIRYSSRDLLGWEQKTFSEWVYERERQRQRDADTETQRQPQR